MGWGAALGGILTGVGAISGALGNRSRTTKTSYNKILSPEQTQARSSISNIATQMLENPEADLGRIRETGLQRIGERWKSLPGAITERFRSRGMGDSAKLVEQMLRSDVEGAREKSRFENDIASMVLQRRDTGLAALQQLLGQTFAYEGENMQPGNVGGGAVNGAISSGGIQSIIADMLRNQSQGLPPGVALGGGVYGG